VRELPPDPFVRNDGVDEPGIIGSTWWNDSLKSASNNTSRRQALVVLAGIAGVVALGAVMIATSDASGGDDDDLDSSHFRQELRSSLAMQQQYGWHFGAAAVPFVFSAGDKQPYDKSQLGTLGSAFEPSRADLKPYYQRVLTTAPLAKPTAALPSGDAGVFMPLADALVPIKTAEMSARFDDGKRWAEQLVAGEALVVDLAGEQSLAFAAGAAEKCDPVLLFENWPHPKGVVPAHLVVAAMAYYQPRFAGTKPRPDTAPPLFVLDRQRLASYTSDVNQFDNRWAAKLPSADALAKLGVKRLRYITPNGAPPELDDLTDAFIGYDNNGIEVAIGDPARPDAPAISYTPKVGLPFTSGKGAEPFGKVPVMILLATAQIAGAKINRSGSWNRVPSYSLGG
jgi:hypothetical protein